LLLPWSIRVRVAHPTARIIINTKNSMYIYIRRLLKVKIPFVPFTYIYRASRAKPSSPPNGPPTSRSGYGPAPRAATPARTRFMRAVDV
jgi:hypothetical protein